MSEEQTNPASLILVIEDEPDIRQPLASFLESEGYRVECAENGKVALEKLSRGLRPGLILLDMKMPVMSGWEFVAAYRQVLQDCAPILVITAAADAEARAREVGACGWLGKPLELSELLAQIRKLSLIRSG
jgi:DNA-binding response OmpR family regulator